MLIALFSVTTTTAVAETTTQATTTATSAGTTVPATTVATTTTTTIAVVTTTVGAETTTTAICPLQDLMGSDDSPASLIPTSRVQTYAPPASVVLTPYGGRAEPWVVTVPTDDSAAKPSITFDLRDFASEPKVTSVSLNPDSNVQTVTVIVTDSTGKQTTFENLPVTPEGQVVFSAPIVLDASTVEVQLIEPVDESQPSSVSPNVQGCFGAVAVTTVITPTETTTTGQTQPSTTTTVSTVSPTGAVVATTTPSTTTTLSPTTPAIGTTTVTTAVVTTTATPTTSTTVICPLSDKMPEQAPELGNTQFTVLTGDGTPSDVQPGRDGWQPTVGSQSPVLQIDLSTGAPTTPLVQSVTVTDTVAKKVIIEAFRGLEPVFEQTVELPESGTVTVYANPDNKLPSEVTLLRITLVEPKSPDATTYDTTVAIVGCFEPAVGK